MGQGKKMNKLEGLFELRRLSIPTIDWKCFETGTQLDDKYLWTVRTATYSGNDLSLPRMFGENAEKSQRFANEMLVKVRNRGIVIYYPYLLAEKSGNLQIGSSRIIIEAVKGDLSNLLAGSRVDVTYIWERNVRRTCGNKNFLRKMEQEKILSYVDYLRRKYSQFLLQGLELQLEFSFAYNCTRQGEKEGKRKLVFFEIRTV